MMPAFAHACRNALGPLRTAAYLLKRQGPLTPGQEKLVVVIERQSAQLAELLAGLDPAAPEAPGAPAPAAPGPKVLIIDDDANDRFILELMLKDRGYQVQLAATGEEGLDQARADRPDIALVDRELPGMSGLEVAARLRALPGKALRLIALTGHGHDDAAAESIAAGFDQHLVKAADPVLLLAALEKPRGTGQY